MSTSKPPQPPGAAPSSYSRFIPREELGDFAAWNPTAFEQQPAQAQPADVGLRKPTLAERAAADVQQRRAQVQQQAELSKTLREAAANLHAPAKPATASTGAAPATPAARPKPAQGQGPAQPQVNRPAPKRPVIGGVPGENAVAADEPAASRAAEPDAAPAVDMDALLREARQSSYQEGYRNGLAALESYKQTQSAQMAAYMSDQIGLLASDFHQRLEALEQQLAGRIAGVALELARQVVRSDIQAHPELVVTVAEEALGTLLTSARQVVLKLHPDDHALAQGQLAEVLAARGARVVADPAMTRGGCVVESDIAVVDASVEARWDRAAASMGHRAPWQGGHEAHQDTSVVTTDERLEVAEDAEADLVAQASAQQEDARP